MNEFAALEWLMQGDVSIQYLASKWLLDIDTCLLDSVKSRIAMEGWGQAFLAKQHENGHWGRGFYQPKWISSHYTLLDLRHLECNATEGIKRALALILSTSMAEDGGVNPSGTITQSDVCINGMFLNYACYFGACEGKLSSIIDFVLKQKMIDGGYNCRANRSGATHSSMHSTISVLEGFRSYLDQGYVYRQDEIVQAEREAQEFLLRHHLFKSDNTGAVINHGMTMLSYPSRWKYDILRALVYFVTAHATYDPRMREAIDVIKGKVRPDGRWPLQAKHPGATHFEMERVGQHSRMNTLRALWVLKMLDKTEEFHFTI